MAYEKYKKEVIVSRYFDENTYLIAGMCWKCYRDCFDVKIVGVNGSFLKQAKNPHCKRNLPQEHDVFFMLDDVFACSENEEEILNNLEEDQMAILENLNDKNDDLSTIDALHVLNESKSEIPQRKIDDLSSANCLKSPEKFNPQYCLNDTAVINDISSKRINKSLLSTDLIANKNFLNNNLEIEAEDKLVTLQKISDNENYVLDFLDFDIKHVTGSYNNISKVNHEDPKNLTSKLLKTREASSTDWDLSCGTNNINCTDLNQEEHLKEQAFSSQVDVEKYSSFFKMKREFLNQSKDAWKNIDVQTDFVKKITLKHENDCSDKEFEDISASQDDVDFRGFESEDVKKSYAVNDKMDFFIEKIENNLHSSKRDEENLSIAKFNSKNISFKHLHHAINNKMNNILQEDDKCLIKINNSPRHSKFFTNKRKFRYGKSNLMDENFNFPSSKYKKSDSEKLRNYQKYPLKSELLEPTSNNNFLIEPIWHPPKSPHNLIEEDLYHDPWALLVSTIFLNKTAAKHAKTYIEKFLRDYPSPFEVLKSDIKDLEGYFERIGLKKRSVQIWRMSHDFVYKNWRDAGELYGVGQYGKDAFNMFCLGNFDVEPKDRYLKIYKAWYQKIYLKDNVDFDKKFLNAVGYRNEEWYYSEEECEDSV